MRKIKKIRLKKQFKYPLKLLSGFLAFCLIYRFMVFTIPYVADKMQPITVFSAGVSFINGGIALLEEDEQSEYQQEQQSANVEIIDVPITDEYFIGEQQEITPPAQEQEAVVIAEERPENSGEVVYKTFTAGSSTQFVGLNAGSVKNLSALSAQEIIDLSNSDKNLKVEKNTEPQVLIYHTHATESYQPTERDWFDLSYNARSTDNSQNMVAVGELMAEQLNAAGIVTIHDTTQHDNPSYTGAYDKSRVTVQQYLAQYPSIKYVLDVHRDAIQTDNLITAPVVTIDGKKAAQIMIISCADDGTGRIPNYRENLIFATKLQMQMESTYTNLSRPILFDDRFYNQDLSTGAILLEMGAHANTLEQVLYSAELLTNCLIQVLE